MRVVWLGIAVVLLLLQPALLLAATGQVLKVVDGDRFRVERVGSKGPETLELHLRCSDAPVLSSLFGQESKQYLESLLRESDSVNFKIQAYCGSELCVEVFAYTPPPIDADIIYINTQMIAAGMARNDSCRGQFQEAEDQAKAAKKGIWSTREKIVFAEVVQMAKSAGAQVPAAAPAVTVQAAQKPFALIEVDRVERTVTLKSRSISLSRAINAIDMVSTQPVSLYLIDEQYLPLALDKVPWYAALQRIVQTANLKQVNMNGKIDLYDQLFYYKHIAPYLKLSDNDGVYLNVRNRADDAPIVDDGVTRYVFVNDFENSAAPPEAKDEGEYGYVQVHKTGSQVPVSNDGRFEIGAEKEVSAAVAVTVPAVERPIPTPYSGTSPVVEQKEPDEVVVPEQEAEPTIAVKVPAIETIAKVVPAVQTADKKSASVPSAETGDAATPVEKVSDPASTVEAQFDPVQMVVLLIVAVVVVFGSIFISRSAAKRAVKAEKSVVVSSSAQKQAAAPVDPQLQVDRAYEQEVFDDLEKVSAAEKGKDGLIEREVPPPKAETVAVREAEEQELHRPEPELKSKAGGVTKKGLQSKAADGGNFAVTPDDYDRLMHPPKREPRVDCLFEVTCRLDNRTITGISLDISSGGLFIDSKEKVTLGKVLELEFRLNEEDPLPIFCRGVVAWVNERPDPIKVNYPNGFGVCFLDMESATEKLIAAFLYPTAVDAVDGAEEEHDS